MLTKSILVGQPLKKKLFYNLSLIVLCDLSVCVSLIRTLTLMRISCWRQPSSWLRRVSVIQKRSTLPPITWRSEFRSLCGGWSRGNCCWISPCLFTPTPKRSCTHSHIKQCFLLSGSCNPDLFPLSAAVDVDGGPAEDSGGAAGERWLRGCGSGAHQTVSAAAEQHPGRHAQCHQRRGGAYSAPAVSLTLIRTFCAPSWRWFFAYDTIFSVNIACNWFFTCLLNFYFSEIYFVI